jgi:hypothetical protein
MATKNFKWNGVVSDHPLFCLYRKQKGDDRPFAKAAPKMRLLTPAFMTIYFDVYGRNEVGGDSFKEFLLLLWKDELCRPDTEENPNANYERLVNFFKSEDLLRLKNGISSSKDPSAYSSVSIKEMNHTSPVDVPPDVQVAFLVKRVKAVIASLIKEDGSFPTLSGHDKARNSSATVSTSLSTGDALSMWKRMKNS